MGSLHWVNLGCDVLGLLQYMHCKHWLQFFKIFFVGWGWCFFIEIQRNRFNESLGNVVLQYLNYNNTLRAGVWQNQQIICAPSEDSDQPGQSEDSDQTGWMPRLIWVFTGRTGHFVGFGLLWLIFLFHTFSSFSWIHCKYIFLTVEQVSRGVYYLYVFLYIFVKCYI